MKNLDISLCLIVKNDEKHLARLLHEARPWVKEIVVVDTGSTDNTFSVAMQGADTVRRALNPGDQMNDFSAMRNISFSLAKCPWMLWLDADDTLSDWSKLPNAVAWSHKMREVYKSFSAKMLYYYTWNEDRSTCTRLLCRPRIINSADNPYWKYPVHETINFANKVVKMTYTDLSVIHLSQGPRGLVNDRDLDILLNLEAKGKFDPGYLYFNLGNEMFERKAWETAIRYYEKVPMTHPLAINADYKCAFACRELGDREAASAILKECIRIHKTKNGHVHWLLALLLYEQGLFEEARKVIDQSMFYLPFETEEQHSLQEAFVHIKNQLDCRQNNQVNYYRLSGSL